MRWFALLLLPCTSTFTFMLLRRKVSSFELMAFVQPPRRPGAMHLRLDTRLFYVDDTPSNNDKDDRVVPNKRYPEREGDSNHNACKLPVIGSLPGAPPLLVGSELYLNAPTPLQWQALEEACQIHRGHQKDSTVPGIDSAPLVAVIDEYTGSTSSSASKEGRYATIAAVLGVTTSRRHRIDLTDASSFMESLSAMRSSSLPQGGKVRLLGIGRVTLHSFHYQVPSASNDDEETVMASEHDDADDYYEDEDDFETFDEVPNVLVASFRLVLDDVYRPRAQNGDLSLFSSPMHAVAEMSRLACKLQVLHSERIQLVSGIKAALIRLDRSETAWFTDVDVDDDMADHDGFGVLFAHKLEVAQRAVQLSQSGSVMSLTESLSECADEASKTLQRSRSELLLRTQEKDNYGLGVSSSSISTILELTSAQLEKLCPYYSPARRDTEEHYYEILSFVAVQALRDYVGPEDLGRVLKLRSTSERLQEAYSWMHKHVFDLLHDTQELRRLLISCGEECTDLF
jgi:hypothetical protein